MRVFFSLILFQSVCLLKTMYKIYLHHCYFFSFSRLFHLNKTMSACYTSFIHSYMTEILQPDVKHQTINLSTDVSVAPLSFYSVFSKSYDKTLKLL